MKRRNDSTQLKQLIKQCNKDCRMKSNGNHVFQDDHVPRNKF